MQCGSPPFVIIRTLPPNMRTGVVTYDSVTFLNILKMAKKHTKINNRYDKTTGDKQTTIVFEKGCVMEYEELWTLLVNAFIAMKANEIVYAPSISSSEGDKVRSTKKIIVEIREQ